MKSMNRFVKAGAVVAALVAAATASPAFAVPVGIDIRIGPPPVRFEAVPAPRVGYVWTPGYWDWRGQRHFWVAGRWVGARPGYVYAQPTWVNNGGRWHLYRGAWARHDRGGAWARQDRDHDGIRNRFDRDRDGDGIRNRHDRHPDNPRRR